MSITTSYAATLKQAQEAYDNANALLTAAAQDKATAGSIAHHIDQVDTETKTMRGADSKAATYDALKSSFIQFMSTQLVKYETANNTKDVGLKAIETVKAAQATCTAFKAITPAQHQLFKNHLAGLGTDVGKYEERNKEYSEKIVNYDFTAQIATLTTAVSNVAKQITALENSLDAAYKMQRTVEGKAVLADLLPSFTTFYLSAAIEAKKAAAKASTVVSSESEAAPATFVFNTFEVTVANESDPTPALTQESPGAQEVAHA